MNNIIKTIKESLELFVEEGANLEHDRWARWQKHMFSKMYEVKGIGGEPTGDMVLPKEFVERWFRQIDTPYSELSEPEKESYRKETRNYLPHLLQSQIRLTDAVIEDMKERMANWHGTGIAMIEDFEKQNQIPSLEEVKKELIK